MAQYADRRATLNWSPEPQVGAKIECFRHNPYSFEPVVYGYSHTAADIADTEMPEGTRHPQLWGRVSFVPFPQEMFEIPAEALPPADAQLVRVFLGQLPYFVTDMELNWMIYTLGGCQAVMWPERIMKRQSGGERLPTGCLHAYATPEAIAIMAACMHKRMLVDDTGVWHAQTDEERRCLSAYVAAMKSDRSKRVPGRPYDSVVIQEATSSFIPACPVPLSEFPTERPSQKVPIQRLSPPPYFAPPSYDASLHVPM